MLFRSLQLYDEFTPIEHIDFLANVRSFSLSQNEIEQILKRVNLYHRKNDFVRTFSSGMKQRLKYALALLPSPPLLILDEPTSNLDDEGTSMVFEVVQEQKEKGLLIVATNVQTEQEWCKKVVVLGS